MSYKFNDYRLSYFVDDEEKAYATFPLVENRENLINITGVYVDSSLRGHGVGGELVKLIADKAGEEDWRVLPTCPFAVRWFESHPEYQHLLISSIGK